VDKGAKHVQKSTIFLPLFMLELPSTYFNAFSSWKSTKEPLAGQNEEKLLHNSHNVMMMTY